jgi:hypothetical protein
MRGAQGLAAGLAAGQLAWMRGAQGPDAVQRMLDGRVLAAVAQRADLLTRRLVALGAHMPVDAFMERLHAMPEPLADALAAGLRPWWGPDRTCCTPRTCAGWCGRAPARQGGGWECIWF